MFEMGRRPTRKKRLPTVARRKGPMSTMRLPDISMSQSPHADKSVGFALGRFGDRFAGRLGIDAGKFLRQESGDGDGEHDAS